MSKTTKTLLVVVIVIAAVLIWVAIYRQRKLAATSPENNAPATVTDGKATSTPTPASKVVRPKPAAPAPTYSEVVQQYAGKRFQFSNNCGQVTPASFVLDSGTKFMIDNLDSKTHVFTFGTQKFTLKAYNYVLVTAKTAGKVFVLCDGVQRAWVNVY